MENLAKAQEEILNLCREHNIHKKTSTKVFEQFAELRNISKETEIFNKTCSEMIARGWNNDYASEKTWSKLESEALDLSVGNVQGTQNDNKALLNG